MQKIVLVELFCAIFSFGAYADDSDIVEQIEYKEQVVQKLREESAQINSEMLRCNNSGKNWKAATVFGGAGVVATGTAAIVQTVNANKSKKEDKK